VRNGRNEAVCSEHYAAREPCNERRRQGRLRSHLIPPAAAAAAAAAGRATLVCGIELQRDVSLVVEIPVPDVQKHEKIY
jgi:hypothetical protein